MLSFFLSKVTVQTLKCTRKFSHAAETVLPKDPTKLRVALIGRYY